MKNKLLIALAVFFGSQSMAQNVGIGTATPIYKLQVEGDAYVNGGWLRIDGNRGVLFEDYGGGWYMQDATWIRSFGDKSIYHNTGVMRTDGTFQVGGSGSTFYAANGGNMAYRTDVLFANTAGNVGIGTASPSQKLEITGGNYPSILFSNNVSGRDLYVGGGSQSSLGTTEAVIGVTNGNIHIDSRTSNQIYFQHYAAQDAIFNVNGGSVGIGTASPGYKLDVSGTGRFTGQLIVPVTPTANAHAASKQYVDNQVGSVTETDPTWTGSANTTSAVSRTGNISVGDLTVSGDDISTNADMRLHANGGYIDFRANDGEHGLILRDFDGSSTSWGGIRVVDSDRMEFRMDGGSYGGSLVVKDNNNVGIGVTSPAEKLDVSGDIKASGEVYWGNGETRTQTRHDAGDMGAGIRSGFYESSAPVNYPSGASSWWHLLDVRHSNDANNYAMQIAGSFFDQNLWYRKTDNSATTSWSKIMSSNDINGTTNYVGKFTGANSIGNSMIYDNGSRVGIGTTSIPSDVALEVNGAIGTSRMGIGGSYNSSQVQGIWTIAPNYKISTANNDFGSQYGIVYAHTNAGTSGSKKPISGWGHQIMLTSNGTRNISMSMSTGNAYFAGNVGIGTTSPSYDLHVIGRIKSNGINETSDIRFKKDINPLENSLDKLLQLKGVSYHWRTDEFPDRKFDEGKDIGVIAQEVEKIFPELVDTDNEGYKSVQYTHLVPVLIEALKEMNTKMSEKEDRINFLEAKLDKQQLLIEQILEKYKTESLSVKK